VLPLAWQAERRPVCSASAFRLDDQDRADASISHLPPTVALYPRSGHGGDAGEPARRWLLRARGHGLPIADSGAEAASPLIAIQWVRAPENAATAIGARSIPITGTAEALTDLGASRTISRGRRCLTAWTWADRDRSARSGAG
jgi:hypothetical protein